MSKPKLQLHVTYPPMVDSLTPQHEQVAYSEAEDRFYKSFHFNPVAMCLTRVSDSRFVEVNQAYCDMVGYARDELIGKTSFEMNIWDNPDDRQVVLESFLRDGFLRDHVVRFRTRSGDSRLLSMSVHSTKLKGADCFITSQVDITEREQEESKLQLAASVFSHAREGILITDAENRILDVNDAFTRITSYSREEVLGRNPRMLQSGRHTREFYKAMWRALSGSGYWSGEMWNRRKDGEVYAEMRTISAVRDAAGKTQHYVALFSDITPMKKHQAQLEHIAHYDALTHLPNRVLLEDRLQQAMIQSQRRKQALAVVFLDLDGFKKVNDTFGHTSGDELLIVVAQRMTKALRECDTLARIGGDEFVAVLVDLEQSPRCEPVLERLLQAAADPVNLGEAVVQVSASIGVTFYPQIHVNADELLRQADQAMYQAKQAGKNRYRLFDVAQAEAENRQ